MTLNRISAFVAVIVCLIGTANARSRSECRGVTLSQEILGSVKTATEDPAVTFAKNHPGTAKSARPAWVKCASKLWRAKHPALITPAASLSPAGRRAISAMTRPGGQPQLPVPESVTAYAGPPEDHQPVIPVRTPPLRNVRPIPPPHPGEGGVREIPEPIRPAPPTEIGGPDGPQQTAPGALVSAPTATGLNFAGVGIGLAGFVPSSNPPDTNGRVGATQYVQWNNTSFAVFDKTTGALLYGPAAGNTLFQSLGGACASHNDGDPVVAYDLLAGRWILSQFVVGASPNFSHQCVAVSQTQDATGAYFLYDFVTDPTNFVDYPKIGVWPDGYYMTSHVFNAAGTAQVAGRVNVFERQQMILGQPARQVAADLKKYSNRFQYGFLPADLDSVTPPPAGEAAFVLGPDPAFTNRTDSTRVAVTWGVTPTITLTQATIAVGISPAPCVNNTAAQDNRDCVPQPAPALATDDLDNLSQHYMYRLAYRNFGGGPVQESLVANGTTAGSASTPAHGALRWFEFRNAGNSTATPTSFQAATYDPDTDYRWMGSIAMDKDHNIALGYSKSSPSVIPGIFMTGRLGTDTINTMGAETTVFAGVGVQTAGAGNRWGDYSAMTLDPVDQCTFWYTNEYLSNNGAFNWATRIASYKFPSCTSAAAWGTISGTITSCATGAPLSGVVVTLSNGFAGASDASGNYSISVPAGTYTASAADSDRNCSTGSPATVGVTVASGGTATQSFCMTGNSNLQFNALAVDDSVNGNNNGVVNSNECVNLNVTVKNNGCANESAIAATLTTSTTGVTVTQGSSAYPDMVIDASGVNATPFRIQTSNSFVCGTIINLTLHLTYASGNKSIGFSVPTCGGGPNQSIPTSAITLGDLSQTDRLGRDGVPSTCAGKGCPGGIGTAGTRNYKTFNFTNSGGAPACITVQINAACGSGGSAGDIESAAYLTSYSPANLCTNYLGDSGVSGLGTTVPNASYSFDVPASSNFVVVVNTNTGSTTCTQFSGIVSGFFDFTAGPGACPGCTPPATPTASNTGPYCQGATISLSTPTVGGATYAWTGPNGFTSSMQNPTRTNAPTADAGTYSVTVTVAGCTSAAGTTNVVVNPTPATPTAWNTGPYCAGATISLSTPTVTGATYAWSGPNGFTSTSQSPTQASATTADAGTYSVTVTVNGCTSAAGSTNVVVNPIPATPTASNGGPYCSGQTIVLSTPTVASATYAWTGPNGFTSTAQNPTRSNSTTAYAGTYSVTVTVNGCTSAAGTTSVVVNQTPATPTASNTGPYCAGATISLSTPTVTGATYAWSGPNGFTSTSQSPTQASATTADAGTYSVTVTVNGCTSAAGMTNVVVNAIPATPTASNGGPYCSGQTLALSTPTVTGATYAWTGPNGFTSSLQNPTRASASTADAGTYSVTVTVNGCTSAAGTTGVVVNPTPATPTASNTGQYCAGATISLSTPTVASATYAWTGPNGFTSSLQNPTRASATTADGGTYSVTVTVGGCTSAAGTTSVVVNATPATPTASNTGPYCAGGTISLSTPTVTGATYAWSGPNGFTSSLQNPTRASATTADAGTYSVTVTVNGCPSAAGTTNAVVNPIPATPTASNTGPYCAGATISLSTPAVGGATYSWTGPNAFVSSLQNPTRSNATTADAGTYSVIITVAGCPSAAGTTSVVVNPAPATPSASNTGPYCAGATISLSTPTVSGATYAWTGPNGFTSSLQNPTRASATTADAGTYSVTLTVSGCTSAAGTTNVVVNAIPATPTASNGGPYCAGATIALSTPTVGGATYSWTGPNGFTSSLQNPTRTNATTADAGTYSVTITVAGCTSAAGTTNVVVNATPATPTASNTGPYCAGATISLSTPTVGGATYSWTGPNGFTSSAQNPTRSNATTADAGTYSVTVTVSGCTSAAGTTNVVVNPIPATPMASNSGPYCAGATIALSTPTVASATYSWSGPNGFTSTLQNPTRTNATTADAGTYSVTITVAGCTSAAGTTNVVVNPIPPTPTITPGSPTTFCAGGSVMLTSSSGTGNQWFRDGVLLPGATFSFFSAGSSGSYTVTVTSAGCTSAASSPVVVTVNNTPGQPTITPGGPTTFCSGGSVTLTSSSASGNQWSLNGNPIGGATNQSYVATIAGDYTVVVTSGACSSAASAPTTVTVNALPPTPTITPAGSTTVSCGGSVTLNSSNATGNQWFLEGSPIGGATGPSFVASVAGNYTVTVTSGGCSSAPSAPTTVTVSGGPATPAITPGGPTTFCAPGSVMLTSNSASANQWFLDGSPIGGATNQTYNASATGNYTVTVTAGSCSASSAATAVTVNPIPATPTINVGGPTTFCAGGAVMLTSSSNTGNQWFKDGVALPGANFSFFSAGATGNYTVTVTSAAGCISASSTPVPVTVNPTPGQPLVTAGGPTTFCAGGSVTLTSNVATGNQWFKDSIAIGGATGQSLIATTSGSYTVQVTSGSCSSTMSAATAVTVTPLPATPTITPSGGPTTFCAGGSVTLTSSSTSGNQWYLSGLPIGGATNQSFIAAAAGNYTVQVTSGGCTSATSAATTVTINADPDATISVGSSMGAGAAGAASVADAGVGASYSWGITNGSITGGAGTRSITFTASAAGTLTLNVTVTSAAGCSDTKSANVNVTAAPPTVTITTVAPGSGSSSGGTSITVTGTGFQSGATLTLGAVAATNVIVVNATTITAVTPAHSAATVDVTVTNPDSSSFTLSGGFVYTPRRFDPNGDGVVTVADVFYLINYLFANGPLPAGAAGMLSGDANNDGVVNVADVFYTINALFANGPAPQ